MDDRDAPRTGAALPRDPPQQPTLLELSAEPDHDSDFSEFYRSFVPTLVAFLLWQGARLPDAADIAQDTMIKAYQRWSKIHHPEAWTRRVASRELVRRIASVNEDPVDQLPEHNSLVPSSLDVEAWEQRHEVLRVLDRLSPRQRQVMAWTLDGYTPTEISAELQITPEAVRANLMKRLRCPIGPVARRPAPQAGFRRCRRP